MSCPASSFNDARILLFEKVLGGSGIAAIVFVFGCTLYRVIMKKPFSNPAERLIVLTFFPVLVEMVGKSISNTPWQTGNLDVPLCQAQTGLIEFGNMASIFLALLFAWDMLTLTESLRSKTSGSGDLHGTLIRRERFIVPLAYVVGAIFAGISVPLACPRDFWCWVSDTFFNNIIFFYGWMWVIFVISIAVILYFLAIYLTNRSKYNATPGILPGSLASFTWILVVDIIVWGISSVNRFISYSGTTNTALGATQALISSSRGLLLCLTYALLVYNEQFLEVESGDLVDITALET